MPDEQTEQLPVAPEQPESGAEQPTEVVADAETQDVAAAAPEDVAERPAPDLRALLTSDDGIDQLLSDEELGRVLKGRVEKEAKDAAYRERMALEKAMREQTASTEFIAEEARNLAAIWGVNADDERLARHIMTIDAPRYARAQNELNELYYREAIQSFSEEQQERIQAAWDAAETVEQKTALVGQVVGFREQSAADRAVIAYKAGLRDAKPEDLRKDPELVSLFERWAEAEDASEASARARTANAADPGPSVSRGEPSGTNRDQEIDTILSTRPASSREYQEAFQERYGFAMPVR